MQVELFQWYHKNINTHYTAAVDMLLKPRCFDEKQKRGGKVGSPKSGV